MHTEALTKIVARNVAKAMKDAGENPSSLAQATGIHRTTLTRKLTGNADFKTTELERIAEHLNTTAASLMVAA